MARIALSMARMNRLDLFDDEICARLLAQAQILRADFARRAWQANLTTTDFLALRQMIRSTYAFSPSDIARVLACTRANATKVVQRLQAAGYIDVRVDILEPKYKSLTVTTAGREAYARAHHRMDTVNRFSRLSEQDRKDLYRLLGLIGPRPRELTPVG